MRLHPTVPLLLVPVVSIVAGCASKPTSVEVSVIDGRSAVRVDGRPFPHDRMELRQDRLVLHDERGRDWFEVPLDGPTVDAIRDAHRGPPGGPSGMRGMGPRPRIEVFEARGMPMPPPMATPMPPPMPMSDAKPEHWGEQPPPVMLGVILDPGGEVARRRGADPARTSHVPDLAEHHPAGRHGLQDGDLIVGFNGNDDGSPGAIRTQLRQMKPGDEISFKVLRGDPPNVQALEFAVKVEPFDLGKMARQQEAEAEMQAMMQGAGFGPGPDGDPFLDLHQRLDRVEAMLGEILYRLDQRDQWGPPDRGPRRGGPRAGGSRPRGPGPGR